MLHTRCCQRFCLLLCIPVACQVHGFITTSGSTIYRREGMMIRLTPSQRRSATFALPQQDDDEGRQLEVQASHIQTLASVAAKIASTMEERDANEYDSKLIESSTASTTTATTSSTTTTPWSFRSISIQDLVYTPQTELISGILVLLSCSLTAVSTLPDLPPLFCRTLVQLEEGIAFFLFLEFLAEWWYNIIVPNPQDAAGHIMITQLNGSSKSQGTSTPATTSSAPLESVASFWSQQWKYFTNPLVLIDVVVVVLPVVLPLVPDAWFPDSIIGIERLFDEEIPGNMAGSGLINLRLLRLLRWQRVLQDLPTFQSFQSALLGVPSSSVTPIQPYQLQLARVLVSIVTLLSVSAGLIYTTERQVNPNLTDFFSALYFTLTTLTTVGFGDITPVTPQGKMVVSASILAGIAILPPQAASLVDALMKGNSQANEAAAITAAIIPPVVAKDATTTTSTVMDPQYANGSNGVNGVHASAATINGAAKVPNKDGMMVTTMTMTTMQELELPKLDLQTRCESCGASTHWSKANYCWSCGSRLITQR